MWSVYVPPTLKTYKNIMELVQTHYSPKPSVIVQRLIAHLKQLMKYCDFHHSLEAMLHDRFMCGINDTRIQ